MVTEIATGVIWGLIVLITQRHACPEYLIPLEVVAAFLCCGVLVYRCHAGFVVSMTSSFALEPCLLSWGIRFGIYGPS